MQAAGGGKLTEGTLGASRKAQGKYLDFLDILLTVVVSFCGGCRWEWAYY